YPTSLVCSLPKASPSSALIKWGRRPRVTHSLSDCNQLSTVSETDTYFALYVHAARSPHVLREFEPRGGWRPATKESAPTQETPSNIATLCWVSQSHIR